MDWVMIKERVELLAEEFNIPIWVTEFDWNGDESVEFGDHTRHAEILENFYRLMFSLEVIKSRQLESGLYQLPPWLRLINIDFDPNILVCF